jgi:hypothetical protein
MLRYKNLTIIPTYHSNLDFVQEVRKAFYLNPPDVIAVEFPENLRFKIIEGVNRLPRISVVVYFDEFLKEQLFIPIVPSDSLIEAIRLSQEYGISVEFIDLFVKNYNPTFYSMPDSYALNHMSLKEFFSLISQELKFETVAEIRYQIEELEKIRKERKEFDDGELLESENSSSNEGDDPSVNAQAWIKDPGQIDSLRDYYMAAKLKELMTNNQSVLVVMGLAHWPRIRNLLEHGDQIEDPIELIMDVESNIFNILEKDLTKIMIETPNIVFQWEIFRHKQKLEIDKLSSTDPSKYELIKYDYFNAIKIIIFQAIQKYKQEYNEDISLMKLKSLFQYMRNLPIIQNMIKPTLFEIVLAAKSIINDDFAWIVWDECKIFIYAKEDINYENLEFTDSGIFIYGKHFKLRRSVPIKIRKIKLPLKAKPEEQYSGEWRDQWNKNGWNKVSHLPEDIFEENYFQHIRQRSMGLMRDQFYKIHEFTSTLMDGIDFKETLRNWAFGQKIYVKEERSIRGSVDSVVIIYDQDNSPRRSRYPYLMMWYAEHDKESDLGFYSTFPGEDLVGPGISRVELGGVVSFFPPRGVPNIWSKEFEKKFPIAKTKAGKLLMAAIIYAQKKFITYVAKKPPSSVYTSIASKFGIKIIHIPLDRFNPVSLHALRNLHLLAGKQTRKYAHKYINRRRY